ncbi:MAG: hypothetical protein MI921_21665 [Cytophagales bacterium]|nr:hypothetical protein [Cytophagales bacterium]
MKRNWTSEIIFPLLDEKARTDQSRSAFCRQHDMNKSVYYYWHTRWRRKGTKKPAAPAMVPLKLQGLPMEDASIIIEHKGDTKIHLPAWLLAHLPAIIQALSDAG